MNLSKNTAPAILAAMISSSSFSDETLFVVCPSDHIITEIDEFHKGILVAIEEAKKGKIVTFGVKPFRSETGYGYLGNGEL